MKSCKILAEWLYGVNPNDPEAIQNMTSEQKNIISNIISLGSTAIGTTTRNTTDIISSSVAGSVVFEDNAGSNYIDPRLYVAYGDPMEWSKLWKDTATLSGGIAAWLEAKYYSTRIPYFKTGAKAVGFFGIFSLYNAYAFEQQATGKWNTTGIITDVITNTTKISNNPFTEFVLDEFIGNAVDSGREKQ